MSASWSIVSEADRLQGVICSSKDEAVQPKQKPGLVGLVLLLSGCITLIILSVVIFARRGAIPELPDLPPSYLPGSSQPRDLPCYSDSSTYGPACSINLKGHQVYFDFDAESHIITDVLIPASKYRVGDLILAWGTPSGIKQTKHTTHIYWGTRTAYLPTISLRPDSQVHFILDEPEARQGSPWRGFRLP
jgi:hypothetical protein